MSFCLWLLFCFLVWLLFFVLLVGFMICRTVKQPCPGDQNRLHVWSGPQGQGGREVVLRQFFAGAFHQITPRIPGHVCQAGPFYSMNSVLLVERTLKDHAKKDTVCLRAILVAACRFMILSSGSVGTLLVLSCFSCCVAVLMSWSVFLYSLKCRSCLLHLFFLGACGFRWLLFW